MTVISRSKVDHPALGTAGGSALHTLINTIYTVVGDDDPGRYRAFASIANSTTSEVDHNFGVQFSDLTVLLYTGTHPALTRVTDPAGAGWTIAAQGGALKTKIDVTTPSSGGPHTFAVMVLQLGASVGGSATSTVPGLVTSFTPAITAGVATKSAAYVVLDGDGYHTVLMTTGATDKTVTLPTAADNAGRILNFKKVDSGAGKLIVDGEGAETVDGATTYEVVNQYGFVTVACDGTGWHIIA